MKFVGKEKYWYVPKINGNLDLPEDEQLQIEIIRPTAETRDSLSTVSCVRKPDGSSEIVQHSNVKDILRKHVGKIKNLTVVEKIGNEEKEKDITSGEQLALASFYGSATLVSLISAEVLTDTLLDTEKKKLKIAFSLLYDGWDQKEWPPEYDEAPVQAGGHIFKRKEIQKYLDDEFYQCLMYWQRVKTYGFPKPWTETAYLNLQIVELFDLLLAQCRKEELDAADRRAKSSSSRRG